MGTGLGAKQRVRSGINESLLARSANSFFKHVNANGNIRLEAGACAELLREGRRGVSKFHQVVEAARAELPGAHARLVLVGVDLSGVHLVNVRFDNMHLEKIDFSNSELENVNFGGTSLCYSNFENAQLKGIQLKDHAEAYWNYFSGCRFSDFRVELSSLRYNNFEGAYFSGTKVLESTLLSNTIGGAIIEEMLIKGSALTSNLFTETKLMGFEFLGCEFSDNNWGKALFKSGVFKEVGFIQDKFKRTAFDHSQLRFDACSFSGIDFRVARHYYDLLSDCVKRVGDKYLVLFPGGFSYPGFCVKGVAKGNPPIFLQAYLPEKSVYQFTSRLWRIHLPGDYQDLFKKKPVSPAAGIPRVGFDILSD